VSFGLGASAIATTLTAVRGVRQQSASVASAVVNMAQQLGAAFGIALLTAAATAGAQAHASAGSIDALAAGYSDAFALGAALLLVASAVVAVAANTGDAQTAAASPAA